MIYPEFVSVALLKINTQFRKQIYGRLSEILCYNHVAEFQDVIVDRDISESDLSFQSSSH